MGDDRLITDGKYDAGSTGSFSTWSYAGAGKDKVDLRAMTGCSTWST